ncbi:hypothetical protein PO015_16830 [Bacteroides uniformis]|nr:MULTISPECIES: hypothetical protein [Bacteroides]MDC1994318.1 hypothetical protein [Bacteroides uniformis]
MVKIKNVFGLCDFSFAIGFHCLAVSPGTDAETHIAQEGKGVNNNIPFGKKELY